MNHNLQIPRRRDRAGALIAVAIFGVIISICAAFAYRSTIFQTQMASRSYEYLSALNVAEAGAERAMLELNKSAGAFSSGWSGTDPKKYSEIIQDSDGQNVGEVFVQVTNIAASPRVTATGYVPNKANARLMRTVQLNTKTNTVAPPWGEFGLFAFGNITMDGGAKITSFVPTNLTQDTKKATVGALGNIKLLNGSINGNVHAGGNLYFANNSIPVTGSAYYGGSFSYEPNNYPKVTGEIKKSSIREPNRMTSPVKPVYPGVNNNNKITVRPLNGGGLTQNGIASGAALSVQNSIVKISAPGTYYLSSFKNNNNSQLEIIGTGEVKIFVTGDFDLSAISSTNIAPTDKQPGPKVTLVAKNAKFTQYGDLNVTKDSEFNVFSDTVTGNGSKTVTVDKDAKMMISAGVLDYGGGASLNVKAWTTNVGLPSNLRLFASSSVIFGEGAHVSGILYAPDAETDFKGGFHWWGAVIGKNITVTGGANVRVDETLFTPSGGSGAVVTAWSEAVPKKI